MKQRTNLESKFGRALYAASRVIMSAPKESSHFQRKKKKSEILLSRENVHSEHTARVFERGNTV
jgi:hypothetical protein